VSFNPSTIYPSKNQKKKIKKKKDKDKGKHM
jgi:hypothetical protein